MSSAISVEMDDEFHKRARDIHELYVKKGGVSVEMSTRIAATIKKIAGAMAIIENPTSPVVSDSIYDCAEILGRSSVDYLIDLFGNVVAESPEHAARNAVVRLLLENKTGVLRGEIYKEVDELKQRGVRSRQLIDDMLADGVLEEHKVGKNGKKICLAKAL